MFPGNQGGPLMHAVAGKAVAFREASTESYRRYTAQVVANAKVLAETLGQRGIRPTTGGTDTHLSLHDLQPVDVTVLGPDVRITAHLVPLAPSPKEQP